MKKKRFYFYMAMIFLCASLSGCRLVQRTQCEAGNADYIYHEAVEKIFSAENMKGMTKRMKDASAPDYLVKIYDAGNGVYVSEHLGEVEHFAGQLLMEVVEQHGEISEEKSCFFSEWAMEQFNEIDWNQLEEDWKADTWIYDVSYSMDFLFGYGGYDFSYTFYEDRGKGEKSPGQPVTVQALVDRDGMIRGIAVEGGVIAEDTTGLFWDKFQEIVIEEGIVHKDEIVYAQSGGLLSTGDAAADGERIGKIILEVLENSGTEKYKALFNGEDSFREFQNQKWNQLDTGWKANPYYDCEYSWMDREPGCVDFTYYIYPDYGEMNVESAKAVTFRCTVGTDKGKIQGTGLKVYTMTREEYETAREWKGRQAILIDDGKVTGGGGIPIPGAYQEGRPVRINAFDYMGTELFEDLIMKEFGSGWQLEDEYDLYYMDKNEQTGLVHFKYHFYGNKEGEEYEKALAVDVWISENGIEDIQIYRFRSRRHLSGQDGEDSSTTEEKTERPDLSAFLKTDWTTGEILMWDHTIYPQDSAQGWEFWIGDIDFDGLQEFLIAFTSNHCGGNSLYIYRQKEGKAISYVDTIATPEPYMTGGIAYKDFSPYMDIELMNAYVNEKNEYRYLSLDCSSHGGYITNIYSVSLYETTLTQGVVPKEIARIDYCGPAETEELYFQGERVYESGKLRDLIDSYMEGYTKREIVYQKVDKTFARDVAGLEEEEKRGELEELYEAVRGILVFTEEK